MTRSQSTIIAALISLVPALLSQSGQIGSVFGDGRIENAPASPSKPDPLPAARPWWLIRGVDRVISTTDDLCPSAKLVARCIDVPVGLHEERHGDLFENCSGELVLVYHERTVW